MSNDESKLVASIVADKRDADVINAQLHASIMKWKVYKNKQYGRIAEAMTSSDVQ